MSSGWIWVSYVKSLWVVLWTSLKGGLFRWFFLFLLLYFFFTRFPLLFCIWCLLMFLLVYLWPTYVSSMWRRACRRCSLYFAGFTPLGVPLLVGMATCVFEVVSYAIRPVVLVFRPQSNLSLGTLLGQFIFGVACWIVISSMVTIESILLIIYLTCVMFVVYEWCVSWIQWYIVKVLVEEERGSKG